MGWNKDLVLFIGLNPSTADAEIDDRPLGVVLDLLNVRTLTETSITAIAFLPVIHLAWIISQIKTMWKRDKIFTIIIHYL